MQIFSTFEHSVYLELAVSKLEKTGIIKENIFAVPLDNRTEDRKLFDTIHRSDGISYYDHKLSRFPSRVHRTNSLGSFCNRGGQSQL